MAANRKQDALTLFVLVRRFRQFKQHAIPVLPEEIGLLQKMPILRAVIDRGCRWDLEEPMLVRELATGCGGEFVDSIVLHLKDVLLCNEELAIANIIENQRVVGVAVELPKSVGEIKLVRDLYLIRISEEGLHQLSLAHE